MGQGTYWAWKHFRDMVDRNKHGGEYPRGRVGCKISGLFSRKRADSGDVPCRFRGLSAELTENPTSKVTTPTCLAKCWDTIVILEAQSLVW